MCGAAIVRTRVILNPPLDHLAMVSFKPSVLHEFDAAADIRARPLDMSHWVAGRLHLDYANSDPDRQLLFIAHLWATARSSCSTRALDALLPGCKVWLRRMASWPMLLPVGELSFPRTGRWDDAAKQGHPGRAHRKYRGVVPNGIPVRGRDSRRGAGNRFVGSP